MINSINGYHSNLNINSSSPGEVDEIIDAHKKLSTTKDETVLNKKENLYLSSRAQKINNLSKEFFNNGTINFNDVDSLKDRVYELGLISKQEYAQLTHTEVANKDTQFNEKMLSQSLGDFAGNFIERLDEASVEGTDSEKDSNSILALKETLTTAQKILSNIDIAKNNQDFKESLASTLYALKETINADSFEIIPLDDRVGISKIYQALEVIDKISQKRLSNEKVNRYLQISFD